MRYLLVALGIALAPHALAHGEKPHVAPKYDYAKAEPTAFGIAADPRTASRTIRVEMRDTMRFVPDDVIVRQGQTVRFVAENEGQLLHEMVLGTKPELEEHAALMKKSSGMEHDEPYMVHVKPGEAGEIGWKFTRAGTFYFACLIPGHYEAGMIGKVEVGRAVRGGQVGAGELNCGVAAGVIRRGVDVDQRPPAGCEDHHRR